MQLFAATHVAALVTAGEANQLPVLPHTGELIFGIIAIAILYFIVQKWVVPNLEKAYADRTAAIEGGMHQAEDDNQQDRRPEHRQGDVPKSLPSHCTLDSRRFIEFGTDLAQTSQNHQHIKSYQIPNRS